MHPNRTLLIIKRKARPSSSVSSGLAYRSPIAPVSQQNVPSPQKDISTVLQDASSPQQDVTSSQWDVPYPEPGQSPEQNGKIQQKDVPSPQEVIPSPQEDESEGVPSPETDVEMKPPVWKCPSCSRMFQDEKLAQGHISAAHEPFKDVNQSVLVPVPEMQPVMTLDQMHSEMGKLRNLKVPMVTLYKVTYEAPITVKDEPEEVTEDVTEEVSFKSPEQSSKSKRPERVGRSPMMRYISQLYREKKADTDKGNRMRKVTRPRALPPPHYDHWDLDHVPLKCSQCEFQATHTVIKEHYKAEHALIFPTAFDMEARHKKKKYTVFICPCTGCVFNTYWREVINHHAKGHRLQRQEIEGLRFNVFGDKVPGPTGGKKRKQSQEDHEDSYLGDRKRKKLNKEQHEVKNDDSSSWLQPGIQEPTHSVSFKNENKHKSPMANNVAKKSDTLVYAEKQMLETNGVFRGERNMPNKSDSTHSSGNVHSVLKKETTKVTKGRKVVLHRALKAKRDAIKSSMVTSVCQKGGIFRSVQLSKHPVLLIDLKMDRSHHAESVFQNRYVCPYCTFTCETTDPVRQHLDEMHRRKDPTVIDRICYVRKQRCKTFYCWNPRCTFKTAVCEERESHIGTSKCGEVYKRLFGEPVPKVKEKKSSGLKKSIKKCGKEAQAAVPKNKRNGLMDKGRTEKLKLRILELFDEHKSQSLERGEILKSLTDYGEGELSYALRSMAEDSEVVCSGSVVFIV